MNTHRAIMKLERFITLEIKKNFNLESRKYLSKNYRKKFRIKLKYKMIN